MSLRSLHVKSIIRLLPSALSLGGLLTLCLSGPLAAADAPPGKKVYESACMACHMTGVANAPKLGDQAAWAPRVAKGMDALLQSAIHGVAGTAMPPRGTCATCSDADLKAAVEFMVSQAN